MRALLRLHVLALTAIALAGCGDFSTTPASLGRVTVAVVDQNGTGLPMVAVDLVLPAGNVISRSLRTESDGTGEFGKEDGGVRVQPYVVRVTPPATYMLAPGEANDRSVTPVMGQTQHVSFRLMKVPVSASSLRIR